MAFTLPSRRPEIPIGAEIRMVVFAVNAIKVASRYIYTTIRIVFRLAGGRWFPNGEGIRMVDFKVPAFVLRFLKYFRMAVVSVSALKNGPLELRRFGIWMVGFLVNAFKMARRFRYLQ